MGFKDDKPAAGEETKTGRTKYFKPANERVRESAEGYIPTYEAVREAPRRLVFASGGLQKRGKSTFGFSMPKPLAYFQLDANYEHALATARKRSKDIKHLKYFADPRGDIKAANIAVFDRLLKDFDYCIHNFRSVFVDTLTEVLDVRKQAEYGRLTQIMQMYYGSMYSDLRWMVKQALDSNCNVCFSHRLKKEYRDDKWSGSYELEGWRGVMYETQVYVTHQRNEENEFETTIDECTQNAQLMGQTLSSKDEDNDFPHLAAQIFKTKVEDWQ